MSPHDRRHIDALLSEAEQCLERVDHPRRNLSRAEACEQYARSTAFSAMALAHMKRVQLDN